MPPGEYGLEGAAKLFCRDFGRHNLHDLIFTLSPSYGIRFWRMHSARVAEMRRDCQGCGWTQTVAPPTSAGGAFSCAVKIERMKYSLRTLMILVTLVCIAFGVIMGIYYLRGGTPPA